jgi:hypothetical protein
MKTMFLLALLFSFNAHAEGACGPVADAKKQVAAQPGASWVVVTHDQWDFLRGVYVLNPDTLPGLPMGDGAALVTMKGEPGGVVFFIDGERACTPMRIPDAGIRLLMKVGEGVIEH